MVFDEDLFSIICDEPNKYAEEVLVGPKTIPSLRISRWHDVTPGELRVFLGIFLHMGTIVMGRLQDYWKTSRLFSMPFCQAAMPRNRFLIILRYNTLFVHIKEN